jgi:hypothetical protein
MLSQEWNGAAEERVLGVPDARRKRWQAMSQCGMECGVRERVRMVVEVAVRIVG